MKKEFNFTKGDECYEVAEVIDNKVSEILNKEFESIDATLKSNTKITIIIEDAFCEESEVEDE